MSPAAAAYRSIRAAHERACVQARRTDLGELAHWEWVGKADGLADALGILERSDLVGVLD